MLAIMKQIHSMLQGLCLEYISCVMLSRGICLGYTWERNAKHSDIFVEVDRLIAFVYLWINDDNSKYFHMIVSTAVFVLEK